MHPILQRPTKNDPEWAEIRVSRPQFRQYLTTVSLLLPEMRGGVWRQATVVPKLSSVQY